MAKQKGDKGGPPGGGKNIREIGHSTRFQKGHKLQVKGNKTRNLTRHTMTYLLLQPLKLKFDKSGGLDMAALDESLLKLMYDGKGETHAARVIAVRAIERVIKKMEPELLRQLVEMSEGKLKETIRIEDSEDAPVDNPTLEEAARAYQQLIGK